MRLHLQYLSRGIRFASLKELANAVDNLTQRAWRRLQHQPPPLCTNHVARGLAFSEPVDQPSFPGITAIALAVPAASLMSVDYPVSHWPPHLEAVQPSFFRDQLITASALLQSVADNPALPQRW